MRVYPTCAAFKFRNLFDHDSLNYLGQADYGAIVGDSRFQYLRSLQRPQNYSLSFTKKF